MAKMTKPGETCEISKEPRVFNAAVIEQKPPKAGRISIKDAESPLWLRITARGKRTFTVRVAGKRYTFRKAASIHTLSEARKWAFAIRDGNTNGETVIASLEMAGIPVETVGLRPAAPGPEARLFDEVHADYLETHVWRRTSKQGPKKSAAQIEKNLSYALARFKGRTMASIGRADIAALRKDLADGKFPGQRFGGIIGAERVIQSLSPLLRRYELEADGYSSPIPFRAATTIKASERARDRILTDDEMRAFFAGLDALPEHSTRRAKRTLTAKMFSDDARIQADALRMLALTGCRLREVFGMTRDEIAHVEEHDFSGLVWTVPKERMKNGRPHTVPLTREMIEIIERQDQVSGSPLVFTLSGKEMNHMTQLKTHLQGAIKEARGAELSNWVFHDLRRQARSTLSRLGVAPHVAEKVLSHTARGVEAVYDRHAYLREKYEALVALSEAYARLRAGQPIRARMTSGPRAGSTAKDFAA